ncbi:acyltransferase [Fictibacillus sp. S7]|uniref:acyltransferase n=1 Tax=Fictibacillus sp. S7 TaxID=2212476 RepID=UPI0010101FA6|nr:acyltransferase [Fictibacillus sp. S7]RXZ01498.1 transferase [Fictibacillus sp. S7]
MIALLNYIVSKLKKREFKLDNRIKFYNLLGILYLRFISLLRGSLKSLGFKKRGKILFFGKGVKIKHKNFIELGNGVTIEDYVLLDGLSREGLILGDNVKVGSYSIIACSGNLTNLGKGIRIKSNSGIGDFCFFGAAGGISIGSNVIMGQNVRFHSENHNFDRIDIPIKEQGVTNKGIFVGDDCWIGSGVVFLDGVQVGEGCVIGANSLVNKDIPPYSVAVGNPVKVIKNRKKFKEAGR